MICASPRRSGDVGGRPLVLSDTPTGVEVEMSSSTESPAGAVADGHCVLWFVPDRPVEGNTIFTTSPQHVESSIWAECGEDDRRAAS
jgi:hypothetical protein